VKARVLALALLGACSADTDPQTQLVLVADTDIPGIDLVTFDVSDLDGSVRRASAAQRMGDEGPSYVTVLREEGSLGPLRVTARALRQGASLVERVHTVSFAPDETRVVPLHLLARCVGVSCGVGRTCGESGCTASAVDALPAWTGAPPSLRDLADAAIAADAGEADAGALVRCGDAGLVDVQSDALHCGACDVSCRGQRVCSAGVCVAK